MNLIQSIGSFFGLSGDPATSPTPGPMDDYWYGERVFGGSAMSSTAVYACVNVLAQTIASLPCQLYERVDDRGGKRIARNHPLYSVLHDQANGIQTAHEFWEMVIAQMCLDGNSYNRVIYGSRFDAVELVGIKPQYVQVLSDGKTRRKAYRINEPGIPEQTLFDGEILHFPSLTMDGYIGITPMEAARRAWQMGNAAERYAGRVFENSAIPPAYVSLTGNPDPATQSAMAAWWRKQYGGANQGSMGFVYNGEIKTVQVNHRDLQFLELRKFQLEEIARIYRVPLHLVQSLDRSTNNNIEHQSIDFAVHTIRPWLERLEARINSILLGPQERKRYFAEFNLDAIMRGDAAARSSYYASGIQHGWIKPDEARMKENMNPEGGPADRLYIQGAMVPLENAGQSQQPPTEE